MRFVSLTLLAFLTAALLPACSSQDAPAASAPHAAPAPFEATHSFSFDGVAAGQLPPGWKVEGTRSGQGGSGAGLAAWSVMADVTAPSSPNALAVTASTHGEQDTFNLCWTSDLSFRDGRLRVAVKPLSGNVDQGGGVIWRAKDRDDYYICRVNPLESNFRLYRVLGGVRTQLDTETVDADAGSWHIIDVTVNGAHITCTLDDGAHLEADDDLLPDAGGIGLWTKADALTNFDDLQIQDAAH